MFDEKSHSLKMDKSIEAFSKELSSLRTGRANAAMLDLVKVDVYGQQMPINQIGSITTPEPRMINIQVWDQNNVPLVDSAIKKSELGLNPQIDGQLIRLPISELNEERRNELKKNEFIIPLAALVGAPLCERNKKEAISVNLKSIEFLIKKIQQKNKVIYLTTNSGYGVGEKNKFCDEESPLNPISLYGRTKVDAEKIVMKYKNSVGFRLATVFGYSHRMRSDLLVNNFVYTAIKKKKTRNIWTKV